jgi:hypothetical protein
VPQLGQIRLVPHSGLATLKLHIDHIGWRAIAMRASPCQKQIR